jgi:hypothetical protein
VDEKNNGLNHYLLTRPFFASFWVLFFLLAVQFVFFRPFYQTPDDIFQTLIVNGMGHCLEPSEYLLHSNVLIGLVLKRLYAFFPHFPFYGIYLIGAQFLGIWCLLSSIFLTSNPKFKILIFLVTCAAVNCFYFFELQFTVAASLASQGAFFLLASLVSQKDDRFLQKGQWLAGVTLLLSSLIRFHAFLLSMVVYTPFWVGMAFGGKIQPAKLFQLKKIFLFFFLILASCLFDHFYYDLNPEWKEFKDYDWQLSLQQFKNPDYNPETKPVFDSVGWSENDFYLFKAWCLMDPNKYSFQKLASLNHSFGKLNSNYLSRLGAYFDAFYSSTMVKIIFFFFLVLWFFVPVRQFYVPLAHLGWVLLVIIGLVCFMRVPPRVYLPLISFLVNIVLYLAVPPKGLFEFKKQNLQSWISKTGTLLLGVAVLSLIPICRHYDQYDKALKNDEMNLHASLKQLDPRRDQLYVIWNISFPYKAISALDNLDFFNSFPVVSLSWFQHSPFTRQMLDRFGVKNLLRDMVDNPRVFLVCSPEEGGLYGRYMEENYGMTIQAKKVFKCYEYEVYRIFSSKKDG